MKTKLLIVFITLGAICSIAADHLIFMPYHPYRRVGQRYYNVQSAYDWLDGKTNSAFPPGWMISGTSRRRTYFTVKSVLSNGLLVKRIFKQGLEVREEVYFLANHPFQSEMVDEKMIFFIALRTGNFQYTDALGALRTVEAYDYGVPYDPFALAAERNRTNTPSAIGTNALAHSP